MARLRKYLLYLNKPHELEPIHHQKQKFEQVDNQLRQNSKYVYDE